MLKRWLVSALGVLTGGWLLDGIHYDSNATLLIVVLLLSLFSAVLKPLLILLALPFVVLTLGVGILFINALLYLLVGNLVDGFDVDGFGYAFLGALIITFFNLLLRGWIDGGGSGPRVRARVVGGRTAGGGKAAPRVKPKDDVIDI